MPQRSLIVLALGIVIALGTALSLKSRMGHAPKAELSQVLVAATDIAAGQFVRSDAQLVMADWPKNNITGAMLTNLTSKAADFNGAVARRAFVRGEPILKNQLVRSNEGGFMSAVLDPGKRAVSIAVDSTSGNAGFIFPGDRVDLILTHAVSRQSVQTRASETFVENVRVLAVDQRLDNPENKAVLAKTVTLEVTPKQAEEINLAKDLGKISLSLRSLATGNKTAATVPVTAVGDTGDITANEPESLDDILRPNEATTPAAEVAEIDPYAPAPNVTRDTEVSKLISPEDAAGSQVTLIRGSERTQVQFGPTTQEQRREP
ncbi:MAG: Flp pilus assembly protein CpaB [Alphaproteobacteria bacterium]|nr:Flp pilus assembly protein CpaB [Alphaproteobacteria bacterium]